MAKSEPMYFVEMQKDHLLGFYKQGNIYPALHSKYGKNYDVFIGEYTSNKVFAERNYISVSETLLRLVSKEYAYANRPELFL